jgi:hypothetical protein
VEYHAHAYSTDPGSSGSKSDDPEKFREACRILVPPFEA